jgi:hypothetical protein
MDLSIYQCFKFYRRIAPIKWLIFLPSAKNANFYLAPIKWLIFLPSAKNANFYLALCADKMADFLQSAKNANLL